MASQICLFAKTLDYPEGGGHFWVYLNWALGLQSLGCQVIWAEGYRRDDKADQIAAWARLLRDRLRPYGLGGAIALVPATDDTPERRIPGFLGSAEATGCDLALNFVYRLSPRLLRRCRRTALIDIDPGLLQVWMKQDQIAVAAHDLYFSISENVGRRDSPIPDVGLDWIHVPPCVALDRWPGTVNPQDAPFTTITHWWDAWMADASEASPNDKRSAFAPYLDLPRQTGLPLELAVNLADAEEERSKLLRGGWRLRAPREVAATPEAYRSYIQSSRAEFSCAKPWTVRLATAWISDRTICYLASGKPAVVQHTGPSRILPDAEGLLRFRSPAEAADRLNAVAREPRTHAEAARALAERHFDARKAVALVLERSFDRVARYAVRSTPRRAKARAWPSGVAAYGE